MYIAFLLSFLRLSFLPSLSKGLPPYMGASVSVMKQAVSRSLRTCSQPLVTSVAYKLKDQVVKSVARVGGLKPMARVKIATPISFSVVL